VQTQLTRVHVAVGWLGPQTLREVVPFVALAIVLVWRGAPLPLRGVSDQLRLPRANLPAHPWRLLAALAGGGAIAVVATQSSYRDAVVASLIGALLCLSLVVLTGFAGQISLAQLSFAGVSGFALSRLSAETRVPFPLAPLLAAAGAAACAVIVGLPALRARGVSFAAMTLGGALAVDELVFRNLSNGVLKANRVPPPRVPGVDLAPTASNGTPRAAFGLFVLACVVACAAGVLALRRSALGRQPHIVRANERAAAAAGANVAIVKLSAFALSGFLAGVAGTLTAYHEGVISLASYGLSSSLLIFCAAYLGGIGSVAGAFIGGTIGTGAIASLILDRALHIADYQVLLSGLAVIGIAVTKPQGLARSRPR
jgi:branched-chain amino acid transport system permease protein